MIRMARTGGYLIVIAALFAAAPLRAGGPERVVSMHVCTDQLALTLLPRPRIASVSHLAADPEFSAMAEAAEGIPVNHGRVEEVIDFKPDLVMTVRHSAAHRVRLLRDLGYEVAVFGTVESLAAVRAQIHRAGQVLDAQPRAQQAIAALDAGLARARPAAPEDAPRPVAAVYHFNSQTIGGNSLVGDILRLTGYRNLADLRGIEGYGHLSLEHLLAGRPDLLVFEGGRADHPAVGRAALRHPALEAFLEKTPSVTVPSALWSCPTLSLADAAQRLAEARP